MFSVAATAAAKLLQSCLNLCDPIDSSPPGSPVPGILQARTLEWVAISFSNAWKWKWSHSVMSKSLRPQGLQPTRLLHPWDFPGKRLEWGATTIQKLYQVGKNWHVDIIESFWIFMNMEYFSVHLLLWILSSKFYYFLQINLMHILLDLN